MKRMFIQKLYWKDQALRRLTWLLSARPVLQNCCIFSTRRRPVGQTIFCAVCWRNLLKSYRQFMPTYFSAPLTRVKYFMCGRQPMWSQYTRRVQWVRQWTIAMLASLVFFASYLNIYCVHISMPILIVTRSSYPLIMDSGWSIFVRHSSYTPYNTCWRSVIPLSIKRISLFWIFPRPSTRYLTHTSWASSGSWVSKGTSLDGSKLSSASESLRGWSPVYQGWCQVRSAAWNHFRTPALSVASMTYHRWSTLTPSLFVCKFWSMRPMKIPIKCLIKSVCFNSKSKFLWKWHLKYVCHFMSSV